MKDIKTEDIIEALLTAIQEADDWYDECTGSTLITPEMDRARDVLNSLRLQCKTFDSSCEINPEILDEVDYVTTEDEIAQDVAQFVLNHEQHILDNVSDFGLLEPMLGVIKESLTELEELE